MSSELEDLLLKQIQATADRLTAIELAAFQKQVCDAIENEDQTWQKLRDARSVEEKQ